MGLEPAPAVVDGVHAGRSLQPRVPAIARRFLVIVLHVGLAMLGSAALVAVAAGALLVTAAPKLVSMLFEPFSLFLLPGLAVAMALAGLHDFSPYVTVEFSLAFYFVLFYAVLHRRGRLRSRRP